VVVVQSLGTLAELPADWWPSGSYGSVRLASDYTADYETIYRTQPNVRTVVDFIARNIAQLGLHVFRRVSDTDRERLADHPMARLIARPNHATTRYRMIEGTLIDFGVYWNAYWVKVRAGDAMAVARIPPQNMCVAGGLVPTKYTLTWGGQSKELATADVVHFRGHGSTIRGVSPLETLRRVLAEEYEAGAYREGFWRNAARMSGLIERPKEAPEWSEAARTRFKAEFEALYSGAANSGKTAILEEGMTWKASSFSSRDSEYLAGRKLTREEVARAYHVPLTMVGILDHATMTNMREQHQQLYQDCLGPWLVQIEEELELQLLPDFADVDNVYLEFNIAEKLKGSFEEQAQALSSAVGRPWLTADEARARQNLPSMGGDAAELVTPLNVLVGGQASPRDTAPPKALRTGQKADGDVDALHVRLHERHVAKWTEVLAKFFERQRDTVVGRFPKEKAAVTIVELFDAERWDRELGDDLLSLNYATASVFAERTIDALGPVPAETDDGDDQAVDFDPAEMVPYLTENARIAAEEINATTRAQIVSALRGDTPLADILSLFAVAATSRAAQAATTKVTSAAGFGSHRGAEAAGARTKTWRVNSGNPRSQHRAVSGSTVDIAHNFTNGMKWPGDYKGGADQVAGCRCSLVFNREAQQ
jgi:HK97 family phage portal protein